MIIAQLSDREECSRFSSFEKLANYALSSLRKGKRARSASPSSTLPKRSSQNFEASFSRKHGWNPHTKKAATGRIHRVPAPRLAAPGPKLKEIPQKGNIGGIRRVEPQGKPRN